jgi:NADH-ubiquinone oxidoreductase-F iron-sulfur binding region
MIRLGRGLADPDLLPRLERRFEVVHGRGACRHPDGAVNLARSALTVFEADAAAHAKGAPCPYWSRATSLRFPSDRGAA